MSDIQTILDNFAQSIPAMTLRDPDLRLHRQDESNVFGIENEYHAIGIRIDPDANAVHLTGFVSVLSDTPSPKLLRALLSLNAQAAEVVQLVLPESSGEPDVVELSRSYPASLLGDVSAFDLVTEFFGSVESLRAVINNWSESDQPISDHAIFA